MKIDNNYFTRKDVNLSSKVFWLFLWLGGLFYTGRIIVNSSKRYLRYPAQIYEREGDAGNFLTFSYVLKENTQNKSSNHISKNFGLLKFNAFTVQASSILPTAK